jgi:hypothetical protein
VEELILFPAPAVREEGASLRSAHRCAHSSRTPACAPDWKPRAIFRTCASA